jgi:crotonobetainyl-CoA:carnitine CoA-transferase CaiB-like acyl-CoA transferase
MVPLGQVMDTEMPLSDIVVLDATQALSGPVCAMLLADLGAEVIKVEPLAGEQARAGTHKMDGEPISPGFEQINRNKLSLSLDLKTDEGQEIIQDLASESDVFVQNWRPGVAERLGVDYETLKELNDDIIYVQISGYGETGPRASAPAMDPIIQHVAGMGTLHGLKGSPPVKAQGAPPDYFAGYNAAVSTLGAIRNRDRGGGGQKVSISMLESMMNASNAAFENYLNLDIEPGKGGRGNPTLPDLLYGAAEAKDDWIAVALVLFSDRMWEACCDIIDRPDLLDDPRYAALDSRIEHLDELNELFREWLSEHTAEEAIDILNENGIPAGPVNTIAEATELEQVEHRGTFVDVEHPRYGSVTITDSPLELSKTDPEVRHHAPLLGQHNRDILGELGYSETEIDELEEREVIKPYDPPE